MIVHEFKLTVETHPSIDAYWNILLNDQKMGHIHCDSRGMFCYYLDNYSSNFDEDHTFHRTLDNTVSKALSKVIHHALSLD